MSVDIDYNEGQRAAIEKIAAWFPSATSKPMFFLTGDAGTGKTSVAREAAARCVPAHQTVYIAPTGKATSRLRLKGCANTKTLHGFAYNLRGEDEDGKPLFSAKQVLDEKPRLVVLDEASMVDAYDLEAVQRHRIPVLALGDLAQIPPVRAASALDPSHVDHELTQIERQKANSNIIRASQIAKLGKRLPIREYEDVRVREGKIPDDVIAEHCAEDGQVICSYNKTRDRMNARARSILGYRGELPQPGEKVMCWFNQHAYGFMNGEQGTVLSFDYPSTSDDDPYNEEPEEMLMCTLKSLTDGRVRRVKFNPLSFDRDPDVRKEAQKHIGGFDFGYAATIHKSQGSEWPRVMVIEEMMGDYKRMMYTAYTRAQDVLTVYRG